MYSRFCIIFLLGACLVVVGCETAKGFKQDVKNVWGNLSETDDWMKENWW